MKHITIKQLLIIICLLTQFNLYARQTVLHVEAGTLSSQLGNNSNQVTHLILTGNLNGSDIKTIREMESLLILDLKNANIVSGGDNYYEDYSTKDDELSAYMFRSMEFSSIILPTTIKLISEEVFSHCDNLESIIMSEGIVSIGEYAFEDCWRLTNLVIPNTVTTIKDGAFEECAGLINIQLGNKVASIGEESFFECSAIESIRSDNSTPPVVDKDCFNSISRSCRIYVPKGSKELYEKAIGWNYFNNITELDAAGFTELKSNDEIVCYVNEGYVHLDAIQQGSLIQLFDVSGKQINEIISSRTNEQLKLPQKGVYIIRLCIEDQIISKTLIW